MIFPDTPAGPPRIKICGITHPDDAALAVELGADALGLNFYELSPRCLDLARDAAWLRGLPAGVPRIAVLVNPTRPRIEQLLGEGVVDAVQLHGDETETFCLALQADGVPFIKAIRVRDEDTLRHVGRFGSEDILLDAYSSGARGGTGQRVDWELAARFAASHRRTWLAGGLHPGNVAEAVRHVRPFAVDVASGVEGETGPRRKDPARLRAFIAAVRGAGTEPPRA